MGDSLTLYRSLIAFVWQAGVRLHDLRCLYTLVWAVVGLLMTRSINLSLWATVRVGKAQAASKERQLSRWLHNDKIVPQAVHRALATAALVNWRDATLYLALDTSSLWHRFTIVRVSLVYRGRALPLAWCVVETQSATVAYEYYAAVLKAAARLLPLGSRVIVLADRGFNDVQLMALIRELGWHFRIRAKRSLWVHRAGKRRCKIGRLIPPRGQVRFWHDVRITEERFGPVHLALAHVHTDNGYQQWVIISDEPTGFETFDEYGLRFDIEENFLDDKSAGFQLESSEIRDAAALSRLCLILAVATFYLVSTGTAVVAMGRRRIVDTHWYRGLSYLQIGWRWVRHALAHGQRLLSFLWLDPEPDPEPAMASLRQASSAASTLLACADP